MGGVVTTRLPEAHELWDGWQWTTPHAWCYTSNGRIWNAGKQAHQCPDLVVGSVIKVPLCKGTVTFVHNWGGVHSFVLPKDCGRISLAVSLSNGAAVTLL